MIAMGNARDRLVLVGGGHAHLGVLADWVKHGSPAARCILLTPDRHTRYSGMIPGTAAGRYEPGDGLIDLKALAGRAGCELILDRCLGIDPDLRILSTESGRTVGFDVCSIDTGGVERASAVLGEDPRIIDVRPISTFLHRLGEWNRGRGNAPQHVVVAGGGAGGVELVFALRERFASQPNTVTLCAGSEGLLPGLSNRVRRLTRAELKRQDIALIEEDLRIEGDAIQAGGKVLEHVVAIIASFGAAAPQWPGASGLAVDDEGFIAIDRHQRSTSHPRIFAAGDVARRMDREVPHSGVHAVHTGRILAHNLRVSMRGEGKLRSYTPRPASLYLISTGQGETIATYGPLAAQGRWASWLKHRIDTRWVESFAKMGASV